MDNTTQWFYPHSKYVRPPHNHISKRHQDCGSIRPQNTRKNKLTRLNLSFIVICCYENYNHLGFVEGYDGAGRREEDD